jgi:hypothetical protein
MGMDDFRSQLLDFKFEPVNLERRVPNHRTASASGRDPMIRLASW